ncbi:AAA family ATPase [Campylobacter sp. RM12651]|uniref:AAA family ATPase n=1 Tax=Campylobacter sp. RM12651 TaxID=1660079 RepID=UPI001EFBDE20|nr:AAA family ATPase [Campylobacter sp. RM12651]ULO04596.1 hypothetical protein AVBRAN_a0114 [Campylobacter sp. RM12651]
MNYFKQDLLNAKAERTEFLLENLLPLPIGKVSILSASGSVGKTSLALKCALDLATNEDVQILMHLSEDSMGEIKLRADEIMKTMNNKPYLSKIKINDDSVIIDKTLFTQERMEELKEYFKEYKLVVLDPLVAFINFNENDNKEAKEFVSILTHIAQENNQAILFLHHHRKKSNDDEEAIMRGASAFAHAIRVHYSLSYDKNKNKHIIKIEKDNLNAKYFLGGVEEKEIQIFPTKEKEATQRKPIKGIKWKTETI